MKITATILISAEVQVTAEFERFSEVEESLTGLVQWARKHRDALMEEVRSMSLHGVNQSGPTQ